MGGEHWCSYCEGDLSKHQGNYVKLYYFGWGEGKKDTINVVCPDCLEKDEELNKAIKLLELKAEKDKKSMSCSLCHGRVLLSRPHVKAEFRRHGEEFRADVCHKCLEGEEDLRGLVPKLQNPEFKLSIQCASGDRCESFRKPRKDRGINCQNIVVNIDGELYCRKGHPGHARMYRERWALPPSRRRLLEIFKDFLPILEQYKDQATTALKARDRFYASLEEEPMELRGGQAQEAGGEAQPLRVLPENLTYESKIIMEDEEGNFNIPWRAVILSRTGKALSILVPKEEEE